MVKIKIPDFCIEQIANSGQCFRMRKLEDNNTWEVNAFNRVVKIQQVDREICKFFCTSEDFEGIWQDYFDLKRDYGRVKNSILKVNDPYLKKAVEYGYGLRILKQDLWEVIVSFVISQRNNIPRIRKTIEKLLAFANNRFPEPEILANLSEEELKNYGLGYRSQYLLQISQAVVENKMDLEKLKKMRYCEAIAYLKKFCGIGEKVANCIALFGLHKVEAFPVDTWIQKIIKDRYNGNFDIRYFSGYAGIVQQYMFFYERSLRKLR